MNNRFSGIFNNIRVDANRPNAGPQSNSPTEAASKSPLEIEREDVLAKGSSSVPRKSEGGCLELRAHLGTPSRLLVFH